MKPILSALGVLVLLLLSVPAFAASDATNAVTDGCGLDLAQLLAANDAPMCSAKPGDLIGSSQTAQPVLAIHCCGVGAAGACRDLCKQQGPGCKGTIGCRAGECVCTCSCP